MKEVGHRDNYQYLIDKLDAFIRRYYLNHIIRGVLFTTAVVAALFVSFSALEYELYLDKLWRKLMFFSFIAVSVAALYFWVLRYALAYLRLGKRISYEEAARIIGQHFPEVEDKLLNILQLKKLASASEERELIEASIRQKSDRIKWVPFYRAVDLSVNRKYLKYALLPLVLIGLLLLSAPEVLQQGSARIIANNVEFHPPAPFSFVVDTSKLHVLQYDDFTFEVQTKGDVIPQNCYIEIGQHSYTMKPLGDGRFSYTFHNVAHPMDFRLVSGKVSSPSYQLQIIPKPVIKHMEVWLDYPAYTGMKDQHLRQVGDLTVPVGTKISWLFRTDNVSNILAKFEGKKPDTRHAERSGANSFRLQHRALSDSYYKLIVSGDRAPQADSVGFGIQVIPDAYPALEAQQFIDSSQMTVRYLVGKATDDYGLVRLQLVSRIRRYGTDSVETYEESLPIRNPKTSTFEYILYLDSFHLRPGDEVEYYFIAWDNDAIHGSKSTRSQTFQYKLPTPDEMRQRERQNAEEIERQLEDNLKKSQKLSRKLQDLKEKLVQKKSLQWQDKKDMEHLLKEGEEIQKQLERARQQLNENIENAQKLNSTEEDLLEKQKQLKKLFDQVLDKEWQNLLDEINKLLQDLNKDQALEMTDELKLKAEELQKEMDRLLELFKQLQLEKALRDAVDQLEKLADQQDSLAEKTAGDRAPQDSLLKAQEQLEQQLKSLQDSLRKLDEQNQELEFPKDIDFDNEDLKDAAHEMKNSRQSLSKGQNKKASKQQRKAAQKMRQAAQSLSSQMAACQSQQQGEDLDALRQILENVLTLSFAQEDLVLSIQNADLTTPVWSEFARKQFEIKREFAIVEDSLLALAKRVYQIENFILEQVSTVKKGIQNSIKRLEERQKPTTIDAQRRTMTALNELALMLSEAMNQMQQQMAQSIPGSQMCNKPGNSSNSKDGRVPKDKIVPAQKQIKEDLQKMMQRMQNGQQPSSEEFARIAARQAALRKMLQDIQRQRREQGKGSRILQDIINQMDKIEEDLVNKRLTREMLKRQQQILTRLLEDERAERQRKLDDQRKSRTAQNIKRRLPPELEKYLQQRKKDIDLYREVPPELTPYYKYLVEQYYKTIKS